MDRSTARLTSRFLSYGLPFLYLLTSIAFYLHTYDSAQVKITIVQMVGTALVGFWYVNLLCEGGLSKQQYTALWQKYGAMALPLLVSLASGLLSFSHAAYRGPSLDECLRRVFYIHFGLIALKEICTMQRLRRLTLFLLVAVAIATVYGLIQFIDYRFYLGNAVLDPFVWHQAFGDRIFSTFGNPNFFGNFLVILTPITLALMLKRSPERPQAILVFVILSNVVAALVWQAARFGQLNIFTWANPFIVLSLMAFGFFAMMRFSYLGVLFFLITLCNDVTQSKGAWVGYAGGFITFLMLVLFFFPQFQAERMRRMVRQASLAILVIATVGVGFYSHQRVDSIRFRICTWVSTWEMAQMNPVLGNGIGSFRILYPAFRRPQIFHIEGKHNTETDHAEDEYWEVLQDEGVVGFGVFIWVILTFSIAGVRALRRFTGELLLRDPATGKRNAVIDPRAFYMLGILSAFWGMLIHNFMDVSLRFVSSGIFLWLLAGLIGAMVVHDPLAETDEQFESRRPKEIEPPAHPSAMLVAGSAVTGAAFLYLTYQIWSQFSETQGGLPDTQNAFGEQLLWLIAWVALLATIGLTLYVTYKVMRSFRQMYGFVILLAMLPVLNLFWGYFMADVYHNRGIFFSKQGNWDMAIASYNKVTQLNPNYIMAYYFLGNVYTDRWQQGDVDKAMDEYHHVWAIAPNYVQSHHQAGLVFLKKGQMERQLFDQLRGQGKTAEAVSALLQTQADWQQALTYFQKYHDIDPVFEPNYTRMGWVDTQLAEIATMQGRGDEAERYYDNAEAAYSESLAAKKCCDPQNDVLTEHWGQPPMVESSHAAQRLLRIAAWHLPRWLSNTFQFYGNYMSVDWNSHQHVHYSAEMFENLGNVRFLRGRFIDAARAYRMSLSRDPNNARVIKNLASVENRLGNQREVSRLWNSLRTVAPQDPDLQRAFAHGQPPAPHP